MKKVLLSVLMFVCVSGLAFGGNFSDLRSYDDCGTWSKSDNECYNVGGGQYVECDDNEGDAPDKTRIYWWRSDVNVRSQICNHGSDDHWGGGEVVNECPGSYCNDGNLQSLSSHPSIYICVDRGRSVKRIKGTLFVDGNGSRNADCYVRACEIPGGLKRVGATNVSIPCQRVTKENKAIKCEADCVWKDNRAVWDYNILGCGEGLVPGSLSNGKNKGCVQPAGGKVDNGTGNCTGSGCDVDVNLTINNNIGIGVQKSGGVNKTSCVDSRSTAEGKACCYLPPSVATWNTANKKCECADGKLFKIGTDGRGQCIVSGADNASYKCKDTDFANIKLFKNACAKKTDVLNMLETLENKCSLPNLTIQEFNAAYQQAVTSVELLCVTEQTVVVEEKKSVDTSASRKAILAAENVLKNIESGFEVSVWKDEEGKFNTARLASDSIAGVVLGTAGGLITSSVIKKHQIEDGFEDINCVIGGQSVAGWGDEFSVGVQ